VPFVADPPAVYVAKVKNLLVALPPTDSEIQTVQADPTQLATLIDGWMALPEYQAKMLRFFELAFQQTQVSLTDFADQTYPGQADINSSTSPLLLENLEESFARTVLELVAEGQPFTSAITTPQLMMTPALMEFYAFLDAWQVDDSGNVTDRFRAANPTLKIKVEASEGPIPIAQTLDPSSPNYMTWYDPDVANDATLGAGCGQDPIVYAANGRTLHYLLYGGLATYTGSLGVDAGADAGMAGGADAAAEGATDASAGAPSDAAPVARTDAATGMGAAATVSCGQSGGTANAPQLTASDFTSWKMVTLRAPNAGESTTAFYDLPTLRTATELVLTLPRLGFFTPAFFANWQTNTSNQMRVTMNQALIVATGAMVDGTDPTVPPSTPGLDAVHASTAACIGCHRTLDPTRSILAATYSWNYHAQTDTTYSGQPGLFAFQGVIANVQSFADLTNTLATHPLFASAWVQKLCMYANSAPCEPTDPEFQRLVGDFQNSSYSWTTLVRELFSSPLTTHAAPTQTEADAGEVVAVSRRDHLCAALNARLGLTDVCGLDPATTDAGPRTTIPEIVSGLPSDGYGRGAVAPVLPNAPTLFYRAATENICEAVAALVVDAASPETPATKQYSSKDPTSAIADFVQTLMGLEPSDSRAAPAQALLQSHYTAAVQSGATASNALKSTFVAACLAPSAVSIGL
jgi:hypothetical protein